MILTLCCLLLPTGEALVAAPCSPSSWTTPDGAERRRMVLMK